MIAASQIAPCNPLGRISAVSCIALIIMLPLLTTACGEHPLNTITVTPGTGSTTLTSKGQQVQFIATAQFGSYSRQQTTKDVTATVAWASSVPTVATIDAAGLATAVGDGTTVITASQSGGLGTEVGTSSIVVSGIGTGTGTRLLTSIAITPGTQTLTDTGQTGQFSAIGTFTGGAPATVDMTNLVAWSSSNVGVATISNSGLATAVGNGTTTITASATNATGAIITSTATATVSGAGTGSGSRDLSSIAITPSTQTLGNLGETGQFIAIGTYSSGTPATVDLTNAVTWSSSDPSVATITPSGLATAIGNGTTTVTAIAKAASGAVITQTATVTVSSSGTGSSAKDLTALLITPNSQPLTVFGQTGQFLAIGSYSGGAPAQDLTRLVTWTSSNIGVASISASGLATAVGDGTTTITAIATAPVSHAVVTSTATVIVTGVGASNGSRTLTSIAITPGVQSLSSLGENAHFTAIGSFAGGTPTTQDLTDLVNWTSSDPTVATITSQTGVATAVHSGMTTLTASYTDQNNANNVVTGSAILTVNATLPLTRALTALAIIPDSQAASSVGETGQFVAIGTYSTLPFTEDMTNKVTWASSDVQVATINSYGLATVVTSAIENGATAITASYTDPITGTISASAAFSLKGPIGTVTLPTLSVYKVGQGAGTVSSLTLPISCDSVAGAVPIPVCLGNFPVGTVITLQAIPNQGSIFGGWSNNCATTSENPNVCTVTIGTSNDTVGVIFN